VANVVYHAAVRNLDHTILISTDADCAQTLRRVEDFACRSTTLVTVGPARAGAVNVATVSDRCTENRSKKEIRTKKVAERTGLEPATPGVTGRYSNQLNYRSALEKISKSSVRHLRESVVGAEGIEPPTFAL
jgi:hypothetical protein